MIVTLTGNNSFALRQRLLDLTNEFVAKYGELALQRIDGNETDAQGIIEAVQSLPFLAERKMVVLRDLSINKSATEAIEQIIDSITDSTDVVFYEDKTDKRTVFYKTLKNKTQLEYFNELDVRELPKWLVDRAKKLDGELLLADANYLVERMGPNQLMLANELEKLITYDSIINRQTIDLLTEPTPQSKIFELLDAAFNGNKKRAMKLYEEQRAQKVEPQAILAMINWQLNILTLAKLGKGLSADQIAKDSGLNPYPVTKAIGLVARMDRSKLKDLVDEAFHMDWQSKSITIDLDESLKNYIVSL